ncbi:MAG: CotH kinase family protein [Roseburia sp.]
MKKRRKAWVLLGVVIIGMGLAIWMNQMIDPVDDEAFTVTRTQQHVEAMENGADPSLGVTEIPEDGVVGDDFVSHLPLVVIDIGEQEIPVTKMFEEDESLDDVKVTRTGEDPFVNGSISVIDNADYVNTLSDEATQTSYMKIRYRGNSSLNYKKKQFAIKLIDEEGNSNKMSMLSMEENNDWILNISMIDSSLIRNYMAYNLGSTMFPYTPEAKYCEVFFKDGEEYVYQGLYLMMEKIEQSEGRVDIDSYHEGDDLVSYLLCRDRKDETEIQLSTYCSENNLCYGRISVLYPDEDILDDYALNYIEEDIDAIERVLYSDDLEVLETWPNYLDEQSFVDYFLFNELFGNYDAGNNSTYFYKDGGGKLQMGPLWDYDGAMDNYPSELNNPQNVVFQNHPWFEQLCKSERYVSDLEERYEEMQSSIFSAEELGTYIDDVSAYLGNAALRDWSRWDDAYGENSMLQEEEDMDGYPVDRKRSTYQDEVQRLKDFFSIKEEYIGDGLEELEVGVNDTKVKAGSYATVILVIGLVCTVVLIRRRSAFK